MRARRLTALLGFSLLFVGLATVVGPRPAFAVPATPSGFSAVRAAGDPHQIRVAWKPVPTTHHYVVEIFDGVTNAVSTVGAKVNALMLDASNPCAKYLVRVGARDSADNGGTTNWVTVRSLAPGAVGGLAVARGSDRTTARATWRAPMWGGFRPITGYRAQLVRQPDNTIVSDRVVTSPDITLTGVERPYKYTLVVSSQNDYGSCPPASGTIAIDRPGVPLNLTAARDATAPKTVTASWMPPADMSSPPLYYMVNVSTPGKLTRTVRVDAPTTWAALTVEATRAYTIRVQSFNDIGGSPTLSNTAAVPQAVATPPGPDKAPPSVAATLTPAPNPRGWHTGPVTVAFTCTDTQSGVATCSSPVTVTDEVQGLVVTGFGTDKARNTGKRAITVNVDQTPPTIMATASPALTAGGWRNGPVTVTFTCADTLSTVEVCPAPVNVLGDAESRTVVTGTARDRAGNTATTSMTVNIDREAPTITAALPAGNPSGWYNRAVTVTFSCADALSGIASCGGPAIVSSDGAAQAVTGTATDMAGNPATVTAIVNVDTTAPTIVAQAPAANANGWYSAPVTVTFACDDAVSGVDACSNALTLSADGAGQSVTGTVTDQAGNRAITTTAVNIDQAAPTITATVLGVTNAAGWGNAALTIHYVCADILSGIDECPDDVSVDTDGRDQKITRTAIDKAGNTVTAETTVSLDKDDPVITTARTAANGNGWNDGPVTISYACADPLSGIASCSPATTLTTEGANQTVAGTATDEAGNTTTAMATVSIDRTPPTITAAVDTTATSSGWYRGPVTIHYTCSDGLSGIDTCPADVTVTGEGAKQAITRTAIDKAGNSATATVVVNIDTTAPMISATVNGAKSAAGWYRGPVTIHYTCSDGLAGIATCPADVTVDGEGSNVTVTRTAADHAANTAAATVSGLKIDNAPPTVKFAGATDGSTYTLDKMPAVTCQSSDSASGVAIQATARITRGERGAHAATCSGATDAAGNTSPSMTIRYTVTPTVSSLTALTGLYLTTNNASNTSTLMVELGGALAKGRYCTYVARVAKLVTGKSPALTPAQVEELTYWALILNKGGC